VEAEIAKDEIRAEELGEKIDIEDKQELEGLKGEAVSAKEELVIEISVKNDFEKVENFSFTEITKKAEDVMRSMVGLKGEWAHLPESAHNVMSQLKELMIKPGIKLDKKGDWAENYKDSNEIDFATVEGVVNKFNEEVAKEKDDAKKMTIRREAEDVMRSMTGLQGEWAHLPEDAPEVMAKLKDLLIKDGSVLEEYKKWTDVFKDFDEIDFEKVRDIVEKFKREVSEAKRIAEVRELQNEYAKKSEMPVEKANIVEIAKDKNFEGSIIVKTKDSDGRIVGFAIRRNISGDLEGNKIGYMNDGSVGAVYQLHDADFTRLDKSGVLKAYGEALIKEGSSGFKSEREKFSPDIAVENKKKKIEEITRDSNFDGSVIIKAKDDENRTVGYAIRKNSSGELEGNKIGYMNDGSVGWVQQIHENGFAELRENGILAAYEDASTLGNGDYESRSENVEKIGQGQESKYQKWLDSSRSEQHRKKGEKIIEFRKELVENKKILSEIQAKIFKEIEINPDCSTEEYLDTIKDKLIGSGLSNEQQLAIRKGINAYVQQHEVVQDTVFEFVDKETNNVDGEKLYEKLFNQKPQGRVEAIISPVGIYLRLESLNDYTIGYYGGRNDQVSREMLNKADGSGGCKLNNFHIKGLENAIALEKATRGRFDEENAFSEVTLKHETQHVINSLMNEAYNAEFAKVEKDGNKEDINIEKRTKDEISAFFRDGRTPKELRKIFLSSEQNPYEYRFDYADGNKEKRQLSQKYIDLVENGIVAYSDLSKGGYTNENIQAILFTEPLSKWPRVVERFTGRIKSTEEIKNAKDELLDTDGLFEKMKLDPERYSEIIKKNIMRMINISELGDFLKSALFSKSKLNFEDINDAELGDIYGSMITYMKDGSKKHLENIPNALGFREKAREFRKNLEARDTGKNLLDKFKRKITGKVYDIDEIMNL